MPQQKTYPKNCARPFLKWAGGKTQLISTLDAALPQSIHNGDRFTYIEPFIGGGAMMFHMLRKYPNIQNVIINDLNAHLCNSYKAIKDSPTELIDILSEIEYLFKSFDSHEAQKDFFLKIRSSFNSHNHNPVEDAAMLIFLNRTCFNGLYRENSKGEFNVPFGRYKNPIICDSELIKINSELLQKVEILNGDFSNIESHASGNGTFIYFDPPYRPFSSSSNFNTYVKEAFDDSEQHRLCDFFTKLSNRGCMLMLSNSDCKAKDIKDDFLDNLYSNFRIDRVKARRAINANGNGRGTLTELLIRNY